MDFKYEFYTENVLEKLNSQLINLYGFPFCTSQYFDVYYNSIKLYTFCIYYNSQLVHILVFTIDKKNSIATVLNHLSNIDNQYLNAFKNFIFNHDKSLKRVVLNHQMIRPSVDCGFHSIYLANSEDWIISLPKTKEEYFSNFSYHMRNHTQSYISKVKRAFGDFEFLIYTKKDISSLLVDRILEMNYLRCQKKNIVWGIDNDYIVGIRQLTKELGCASILKVNNEIVAGLILYSINNQYFFEITSSDPQYDKYNVGHTCFFLTIQYCIEQQGKEVHLLWGNSPYKQRFLANRVQLYSITIFKNLFVKLEYKIVNEIFNKLTLKQLIRIIKNFIKRIILYI